MYIPIEKDGTIIIPQDILDKLGWNEKTLLTIDVVDDTIVIKEKIHWNIEEFHDNLEEIIERVAETETNHYVTYNDNEFVVVPYDKYKRTQDIINELREANEEDFK